MTELFQKFLLLSLFCAGAGAAALLLCRFLRGLSERAKSNFLFGAILLPIGGVLLSPLAGLFPKPPSLPSEAAAPPPVIREFGEIENIGTFPAVNPTVDPTPAIPTIPTTDPTPAITPEANPLAAVDWWEVASVLWAAVAVFLLLRMIFSHVRLMRSLGRCRKQVQSEKRLAVYEVSADISPFLTGILRGSVYLPENRYSEEERAMALAHEQFHFARGDAFKRIVISVLRCINWLNPPLRIILNRLSDQLEYACDEAVTKTMDQEQKKRYGFMLLKTAGFSAGRAGLSVGLSRSSKALKRRIGIFMQEKKKHGTAAKALAAAVLSAAAVSVVGISAAAFLPETENTPAAADVPPAAEQNKTESEDPERIPEEKLAEWDFGKLVAEATSPEWGDKVERMNRFLDSLGDEELKTAYQKAYALFMISYRSCDDLINRTLLTEYYGKNFYSDAPKVEMADGRDMHPSGYLYEGYENAFFDTFTSDRANAFLVRFSNIAARDGKELVYEEASNTRHCSPEYEILSRTENEIVIRETCYEEDLEGNRLDTILYINDNRFVKEDGTWKCADFETQQSAAERIPEEKLAEWDLEKAVANATDPKGDEAVGRMNRFLDELGDEELKKAYQKAYTLFTVGDWERKNLVNSELLTEYYGEYFYSEAPHVMTEDGYVLHPSGYLYEGYESAVFNTFTRDRAEAFLKENRNIAARDGKELLYEAVSNTRHCCPEYEILSRTENEIVIRETCYGTDAEGNRLDTILYINDDRFVKEEGVWKCAAAERNEADGENTGIYSGTMPEDETNEPIEWESIVTDTDELLSYEEMKKLSPSERKAYYNAVASYNFHLYVYPDELGLDMTLPLDEKYMPNGWDNNTYYCAEENSNVYSVADGTVVYANEYGIYLGYGKTVVIEHENGYASLYVPLKEISVETGQEVKKGEVIGTLADWYIGEPYQPNLGFEIYKDLEPLTYGENMSPRLWQIYEYLEIAENEDNPYDSLNDYIDARYYSNETDTESVPKEDQPFEESFLVSADKQVRIFSGSIQSAFDLPGLYSEDIVPIEPLDEETLFDLYRPFGLTRRESDDALIYQGKLVRWFVDGAVPSEGGFTTRYVYRNESGEIDLRTVWEKKDNDDGSYDPFETLTAIEEFDPNSFLGEDEASPKTSVIKLRKDINLSDILAEQACDPLDPDSMERGFTPGRENYCLFYELPYVTEIYSVADGTVVFSEYTGGNGLTVVVESKDGTCWGYGHCNADYPMASLGDTVKAGDVIGYIGTTGWAADNSLALFLVDNISRN